MYKNCLIVTIILSSFAAFAQTETMPVQDIQPGMKGYGRTVFSGTEIEQFEFQVLEVIPNFKPKRDLIMVRLVGTQVEHTGVVAGMSGSPLYIDGKLIGALSYQLGLFQKEPIAGVTPIADMLEIIDQDKFREQEMATNTGFNNTFIEVAAGLKNPDLAALVPPYLQNDADNLTGNIRCLEMPLYISGFESGTMQLAAELFGQQGFAVSQGGGGSVSPGNLMLEDTNLEPGSAYSVMLVDGDYNLAATGTVTYVDGEHVLGMGHPFLNTGAVGLPMGKAKILTILSSLMSSTKLASQTGLIGTVHQDRSTGVLGVMGKQPNLIPCKVTLESDLLATSEFNFTMAEDRSIHSISPLLFGLVVANTLESARLSLSNQTLVLDGSIQLKDNRSIPLSNYYAGTTPAKRVTDAIEAVGEVAGVIGTLLSNDFESPQIESVDLKFKVLHKKYLADIHRVEVDRTVVRPGDKLNINVYIKEHQGAEHKITHSMAIPKSLKERRVSVIVGSSSTITRLEYRSSPQKYRPENFNQLLDILNSRRKNNFVFFQLRARNNGVITQGKELPGLPPSVLTVMNTQRSSGNVQNLRERVLSEDAVPVDFSISGGKALFLNVNKNK